MKHALSILILTVIIAGCQKAKLTVQDPSNAQQDHAQFKAAKSPVNEKVTFRHNGNLISISPNAMDAHFAQGDQLIVTADDLASDISAVQAAPYKWFFYNDETDVIDNTLGSFVSGPGTPAYGNGSAQISVSGSQRRNLATYQFSGTTLADISVLAFSTYNPSIGNGGAANRSGYLNFNVDFDGTDLWQRRLVFTPPSSSVLQNTWQEWDCINGGNAVWLYSGSTWPTPVGGGAPVSGSTGKTWSQVLSDYPGVRIRVSDSWLGIRVGEPYANGYTENIDVFKFNDMTFDFE